MLVISPPESDNWVYPVGCLQSLPIKFCVCVNVWKRERELDLCKPSNMLGSRWLSAFLRCLLECSEMFWGFAPSLPRSMVLDIPVAWPSPESLSYIVILHGRQGEEGNSTCRVLAVWQAHHLLSLFPGWNLPPEGWGRWMVSVAVARCWAQLGASTVITIGFESASSLAHGSLLSVPCICHFACRDLWVSELKRPEGPRLAKSKLAAPLWLKLGSVGTSWADR